MTKTPKKTRKTGKKVTKPYERTEAEKSFMQDFQARKDAKPEVPKPKIELIETDDGPKGVVKYEHDDRKLAEALVHDAFGTTDVDFYNGISKQLFNTLKNQLSIGVKQQDFDFLISVVAGIEPRDQMEAMLASQMAAVHMQMMTFANRLTHVENIPQQDSAERAFNKLARTFTTQMEALNRYRGKGQQKMIVEHVHVYEGGQAIVGNVRGGGGEEKNREQPHAKAINA